MKKRQFITLLLAATMLLSTGCDQEAIQKAVLENLESALVSGSDTDDEQTDIDPSVDVAEDNDAGDAEDASMTDATASPVKSKRTHVYSSTPIALLDDISEGPGYVQDMVSMGDTIYMVYQKTSEDTTGTWLYSTDIAGENTTLVPFQDPLEDKGYVSQLFTAEGQLYVLYLTYYDGNGYWLMQIDPTDGSVQNTYDLTVAIQALDMTYCIDMALSGHTVYINCETMIIPYDLQTETVGTVMELPEDVAWFTQMYATDEDVYCIGYTTQDKREFYAIDPATGAFTSFELSTSYTFFEPIGTYDGNIYFNIYDGIIALDVATGKTSEVLDFLNCDILPREVNQVVLTADGKMAYYTSLDDGIMATGSRMYLLERIPDEQMPEEVLLTIGTTQYAYYLEDAVVRYNRQNNGVHLRLQNYNDLVDLETEPASLLYADIAAGNGPDLVLLASNIPVESIYRKGVFVDLYPYMDDEENGIDRSQYLENVFEACEQDGKLYSLITNFTLKTMAAKSKYVGDIAGHWTLSEMLDTIDAMPEGMRAFSEYGRTELLEQLIQYSSDLFVDWEIGKTYFASEDFIRLLTFLKSCPEKSVLEEYYDDVESSDDLIYLYREHDMRYYKDTALLETAYIYELNGYWYNLRRNFVEDPIVIGYPTNEGSGTIVDSQMELGICAGSVNKDSAWDFLRYLLTSEDDLDMYEYGLPISKTRFEQLLDSSEEDYAGWYSYTEDEYEYVLQEYGEEYATFYRMNHEPYTKEMGQKVYDLATGATKIARTDENILSIILDEAYAYFDDGETAESAAQNMDSRVSAYMAENS